MANAALARAFRNKTPTEAAEIAADRLAKQKKSAAKKVDEAEAVAEQAIASSRWHAATTAGTGIGADLSLETLFAMSETAANYEIWIAGVTAALGGGMAFLEGYGGSVGLGIAGAGVSRLGRLGIRKVAG